MMKEQARSPQPDSVMPPCPPPAAIPASSSARTPRSHNEIRQTPAFPQSPAVHPQCNSFVSYGPATTMQLMQLLPDTNRSFSATKGVARPYLRCNPHCPTPKRIRHDEIRQPLYLVPTPAIQHQFDTCVSYGPATTIRQIRHLPDTNRLSSDRKSVELSNVLLSGPTTPPSPGSRSASRRNPPTRPAPEISLRGPPWSNTSQLRQWNEWNASQIQITLSQLRTKFHALSAMAPSPTQIPRPICPNHHYETRSQSNEYRHPDPHSKR